MKGKKRQKVVEEVRREPKWEGIPTRVQMMNAYADYHAMYDHEAAIRFLENYLNHEGRMQELEAVKKLNVVHFTPTVGFLAKMMLNGMVLRDESYKFFEDRLAKFVASVNSGDEEIVRKKQRRNSEDKEPFPVSYLSYSEDFDITSVDPYKLTGKHFLMVFDTKHNMVGYFESKEGLKLHRTTLKRVDNSARKRINNPKDELPKIMSMGIREFKKWFNDIKYKPKVLPSRLNKYQLLMRTS